jgi:hypothetical protein
MSVPLTVSTGVPRFVGVLLAEEFMLEPEEPGLLESAEPSVAEDSMASSSGAVGSPLEESSPQAARRLQASTAGIQKVNAFLKFIKKLLFSQNKKLWVTARKIKI